MSKKIIITTLALSIILNITLGIIYLQEKENPQKYKEILYSSLIQARNKFGEYIGNNKEFISDYDYAVADINTANYMLALLEYKDKTIFNEMYGYLTLKPETMKDYVSDIMIALEMLIVDYKDANAYILISRILNEVKEQ